MAHKFEVSQSTYGRWELDVEPNLDTLLALAAFFKMPFGDFITKRLKLEDVPPRWGKQAAATPEHEHASEPPGEYRSPDELEKDIRQLKDIILKLSEEMLTERQDRIRLEDEVEKIKWQLLSLQRQEETLEQAINSMKDK